MKLLMTGDAVGGVWSYALELSRALEAFDVEIFLATMGKRPSDRQRAAVADIPNLSLFESSYKLEWLQDPWDEVERAGEWLLEMEETFKPDIIHLNSYAHGALPWRAPSLIVGHSCVFSWFAAVRQSSPGPEWERYRRMVRRGLQSADLVTAPSRSMLAALKTHYGEFNSAGAVYNGRRSEDFLPGPKEPFILTAGRIWDEGKNIRALEQVADKIPWPIYAAGRSHGPEGGARPLGGIRELGELGSAALAAWLERSAIFVLPARYEPFGLAPLEAALSGCALVLGDIPSLREIWAESALFVSPDDPAILTQALLDLIDSRSLWELMSQKAQARARTFTPERMAREYKGLYWKLLTAPGQSLGAA